MRFLHTSEAPAVCFRHRDATGAPRWVAVARVTHHIAANGSLSRLEPQPKLNFAEEGFGDVLETPLRHESDLAPEKAKVDLVVHANAYAPGGRPTPRFDVALAVRERDGGDGTRGAVLHRSALTVTGRRSWSYRGILGRGARAAAELATLGLLHADRWSLSAPEPAVEVPLRFDHAYGGTVRVVRKDAPGEAYLLAHPDNPVGRGFVPRPEELAREHDLRAGDAADLCDAWAADAREIPAPQIELPGKPLASIAEPYPLAGWGFVAKHWQTRYRHAGTLDEQWLAERQPLLPLDFDPRYWNGAHPDMQLDALPADAVIEMLNLVPPSRASSQAIRVALPGTRMAVHVLRAGTRAWTTLAMRLDTVIVDLIADRLTTLYRQSFADDGDVDMVHLEVGGSTA